MLCLRNKYMSQNIRNTFFQFFFIITLIYLVIDMSYKPINSILFHTHIFLRS